MDVDLRHLKQMHPKLPPTKAADFVHCGAIALQRRGHRPGVVAMVTVEGQDHAGAPVTWDVVDLAAALQLDHHGVTEDGAEAVSLVLASVAKSWAVERRLQRWEWADWLMVATDGHFIALEISGIDGPFDRRRLAEKLRQVSKDTSCDERWASVVAFGEPAAALASA